MITYKMEVPQDFDKISGDLQSEILDKWENMDKELREYCKTHQCDNHYEGTCHEWDKFIEALKIINNGK